MKRRLRTAVVISACMAVLLATRKQHARMAAIITTFIVAPICKERVAASQAELKSRTNFITFSKIDKAQGYSRGEGTKVAVCDWLFDLRGGEASKKYLNPTSMISGQPVGNEEPWHGEWMAELVHQTAPGCKIIPITARTENDDDQQYLVKGIRFAADQGAVAVTCSLGHLTFTGELRQAIEYAEAKGTLFINVHPIRKSARGREEMNKKIICTGVVAVPWHPAWPDARRDVYVWPYAPTPTYKDGWGYSIGPPIIAGVVALMKSVNPALTPQELKAIIVKTAFTKDGFRVLDAEAAIHAAVKRRLDKPNRLLL
jgi:hypothetical protein